MTKIKTIVIVKMPVIIRITIATTERNFNKN